MLHLEFHFDYESKTCHTSAPPSPPANLNVSNGTIFLDSLMSARSIQLAPIFPFILSCQWTPHQFILLESLNWTDPQQYNPFALPTALTLIRCFCLCAHSPPPKKFFSWRSNDSIHLWVFILERFALCQLVSASPGHSLNKRTHNRKKKKKVKTKKK